MPIVSINDVEIHYHVCGKGPTVMLLHGYVCNHHDWHNQIPTLSEHYQVVTWDCRGHGWSGAPSNASAYSIELFAQDFRDLLVHLSIPRSCIVGHSMGGFIALELALRYPSMVSALVLIDTSSGEFELFPGFVELRSKLDELARTKGMEAAFEYQATHDPVFRQQVERAPELREVWRQKYLQTSVEGYVLTWPAITQWKPVTDRLHEIKVPTLIVVGEEDAPFQRASQIMNESIASSRLVVIPGVGHSPHNEAPGFLNTVLMGFFEEFHPDD